MTRRTMNNGAIAMGALLAAGCAAQLGIPERDLGHDAAEMRVTVAEVSAGWRAEGAWLVSPPLMAPDGASRVGVLLTLSEAGEMPAMEARPLAGGLPVGEWVPVTATWSEEDHHVAVAELGVMADGAELRVSASLAERLEQLQWNAVVPADTLDPSEIAPEGELGASRDALRTELQGLGIVTRGSWGARATRCTSRDASKSRMAIHHTVGPSQNPERQMRGIQRYHMDSRGWCDVGYHFLVGADGRVFEGRPLHLLGAHVGGNNTGNIGISFIGCFHSSGCASSWGSTRPSAAAIEGAGRLLGALSRLYGIALDTSRVRGHRDHSGQTTSCPGEHLRAAIGDMVSIGRGGSGPTPTPPSTGGSCLHSYGGTYADTACSAGWQCCDGSWASRGACGGCLCVEETGTSGCASAGGTASAPPPGAGCEHTYGGDYSNTACSAGWQCCDGSWQSRGACGACFCVEETGTRGC